MKNYSKSRAMDQMNTPGLKSKKLAPGTKLTIDEFVEQETKVNGKTRITDYALCTGKDGRIRVPVAELLKMQTADGKSIFHTEEGSDKGKFPEEFVIESSTDRTDRNGNVVYPLAAYNLAGDFLEGKVADWNALVAGGLNESRTYDAVQNYIVIA